MRNTFMDELVLQATINDRIVLIVGDLGYSVVEPFAEKFPDRFINAGVAEQNMMSLAAGMASEGYHVFVYSIANFPTFRCAEQIRNDVAYHNLPVTIVAVGGGLAYGALGYSHHAIQDYGLLRMMPNMMIAAPGDPMEVRACLRYLIEHPQPSYLRLGKSGEHTHHLEDFQVTPGDWIGLVNGKSSATFLTTGCTLKIAYEALKIDQYRDYSIYSMPLWGLNFKDKQYQYLSQWSEVVTLEDHLLDCGFGSWVLESANKHKPQISFLNLKTIGLDPIVCGLVGSQEELNIMGGLYLNPKDN
jgi:transketolase